MEKGISNLTDWYSYADPGQINMFQGDNRNGVTYSLDDFERTIAHEFGHALGIADLYDDIGIPLMFPSIMNNQWEVNGAQSVDYAMMFNAYRLGEFQRWSEKKRLLDRMGITYYKKS